MAKIVEGHIVSSQGLAPNAKARKVPTSAAAVPASSGDGVDNATHHAPSKRPGLLSWFTKSQRSQREPGLSAKQAASEMKRYGLLPRVTEGSAYNQVKRLFEAVPAAERENMVAAARALLPEDGHDFAYSRVISYLTTVPPDERSVLARQTSALAGTVLLQTPALARDYVSLLETVRNIPPARRAAVLNACKCAQPAWARDVGPQLWNKLVNVFADIPDAKLSDFAKEIHAFYAGASDRPNESKSAAFLDCVKRHSALTPDDRRFMTEGILDILRVGGPPIRQELPDVFTAVVRKPAQERASVLEALRDVRAANYHLSPWILGDVCQPLQPSLRDPAERRQILALIERAFPARSRTSGDWLVVHTLAKLPAQERETAAALARALQDRGCLNRRTADTEIVGATPEQRESHLRRLRAGQGANAAARPGGAQDLESVMQGPLQRQVSEAIDKLNKRFPKRTSTVEALNEIEAHLYQMQDKVRLQPDHILMRKRGGDTEINNALRTLKGEQRTGDYSRSVRKTREMANLCALVWHATSAPREGVTQKQACQDRELMRHGLVMALARCIEDDGHRVCGVGQKQYTIDSLKGYYAEAGDAQLSVTPRSLVTVLAEEFYKSHGETAPEQKAIDEFVARARNVAAERYGADSKNMIEFTQHFDDYMNITY